MDSKSLSHKRDCIKRCADCPFLICWFCPTDENDAAEKVKQGIDNVSIAYQENDISRDQLLRLRRLANCLLMYMDIGKIS